MDSVGPNPWVAAPSATVIVTNATSGALALDVTADVQAFLAGTAANVGWILRKTDEGQAGKLELGTREGGSPPVLELVIDGADAGAEDAGEEDAGLADSGAQDAGPLDSGSEDLGPMDAGPEDAGPPDAGPPDTGPPDLGPPPVEICDNATDDDGDSLADCADPECATHPSCGTDDEAPTWPAGSTLVLTVLSSTSARLSWSPATDDVGVTEYRVFGDAAIIATIPSNPRSFDVTGLERGRTYELRVEARDAAGNQSTGGPTATHMPLPVLVVPPLDRTVATNLPDSTAFLYTGSDPVQIGVAPGTIERRRAAMLAGRVLDTAGDPLPGVRVRVFGHTELGSTMSREDGRWEMVVNGGGSLTVRFDRGGYGPVDRALETDWQEYAGVPDVVMTRYDSAVTFVDLTAPGMKVVRSNAVTDSIGTRRPTVLIPEGAQATIRPAAGGVEALTSMHVRLTEYTVGERGPDAMPAELPATSAYTHATEFTVDEALAAGTTEVDWDRPVLYYVENYRGLPVGTRVPLGFYDRDTAAWVADDSGRIVEIVGVNGGLAEVDTDGDGNPEDGASLSVLGISDAERESLAAVYAVGEELWRSQLRHFSTWDCNMGLGFPQDAVTPSANIDGTRRSRCTSQATGSRIECEDQVLAQDVALVGSGFGLHYRSDTQVGRQPSRTLVIPLRGSTQVLPPSLKRIELTVQVAGRTFDARLAGSGFSAPGPYAPSVPQVTWTWDGRDGFGRLVQGLQTVRIAIDYIYDGRFTVPRRFGDMEPGTVLVGGGAPEVPLPQRLTASLGTWDTQALGLGGWTASPVHLYNPVGREILLGTGRRVYGESLPNQFTRLAGEPTAQSTDPGGPATATRINAWQQIATGPDGSVYFVDFFYGSIQRIRPDGILELVAGRIDGEFGFEGDGGPATSALLWAPQGVAVAPDGTVYIADTHNHRVRRVDRNGIITTIAGTGEAEESPDDGPASTIPMLQPRRLAIGPDGSIYVTTANMIRRIGTDGHSTHLVGCSSFRTACVPGSEDVDEMQLIQAAATAVDPAGNLYFTNNVNLGDGGAHVGRVFRLDASGRLTRIAGADCSLDCDPFVRRDTYPGDGLQASDVPLGQPTDVALGRDGSLYVGLQSPAALRVIRILPGGTVVTAVGGGSVADLGPGSWPDGTNPLDIALAPAGVAMGPDGGLVVSSFGRVLRVASALPGMGPGDLVVPSPDGSAVLVFDRAGRLLRTLEPWTGTTLYGVSYTSHGALASVVDADGNMTAIERDEWGTPLAVVGPYGQRTSLSLDTDGYLQSITGPGGLQHQFSYGPGGLLASMRDPRGGLHSYHHDPQGRLVVDGNPAGGGLTLSRTEDPGNPHGNYSVSLTTAEGRVRVHSVNQAHLGRENRTTTWLDGTSTSTEVRDDGTTVSTSPDGVRVRSSSTADPRFGIAAQFESEAIVTMPSGLETTVSATRSVTLADPGNPLSVQLFAESTFVDGREHRSELDAALARWTHRSPSNRVATTTIDARGRPVTAQFGDLAPTTIGYDARGRVATIVAGLAPAARQTTFEYDPLGRLSRVTDPLSRTIEYTYDASNRITQQTLPDGRIVGFSHDENGNVTSITPPGRSAHGLTYTPVDLAESYAPPTLPGVANTQLVYNRDRQVELIIRPDGSSLDPQYDPAGRLDHTVTPEGVYDNTYSAITGQLDSTTSPYGTSLSFTYDGSLPTSTTFGGPITGTVSAVYDSSFRTTEIRLGGEAVATYLYDDDSLVRQAGAMTLTRDEVNGLVTSTSIGGTITVPFYNELGELTRSVAQHDFATVYDVVYQRDGVGRIARKTETILDTTHVYDYRYDTAARLHEVDTDGALSARYTYDDNSNRISALRGGVTTSGTADAQDRLTEWGTQVLTYTPNGELATRLDTATGAVTQYGYDSSGALRTVALPSGDSIEYILDPAGRRIGKKVNGVLEQAWLYQDGLRPIAELDGLGNVVSTFVYATGVNVPDTMVRGGVTYRILRDHLGSVRLVVDVATGTVAQRMEHDEWGRVFVDTAPGFQPFGYAGGLWDADTGLVHFGAREYDPEIGRWTSKEPIGFLGGLNFYGYAAGDPVNGIDPDGAVLHILAGAIMGASVAVLADAFDQLSTNGWNIDALDSHRGIEAALNGAVIGALVAGLGPEALASTVESDSASIQGARQAAVCEANAAQIVGRTQGAAAGMQIRNRTFTGRSGSGQSLDSRVVQAYDDVPISQRSPFHMECAEAQCYSRALEAGVNPSGARMAAVRIRRAGHAAHGTDIPPCSSCSWVARNGRF